jgi:flagellar biosynthesis/type III secretory pathway protein FliH
MMEITDQAFQKALESAYRAGVQAGKEEQYNQMINELENLNLEYKLKKAPGMVFVTLRLMMKRLRHEF